MTEQYRALFTQADRAVRGGWATESFWAAVEQQLLQIENDTLSLRFILPHTFTLEDEVTRIMLSEGAMN